MNWTRIKWAAVTATIAMAAMIGWQALVYHRSVHGHDVGFGDFLAIRVIVLVKGVDFDWTVHRVDRRDFTIHWIYKEPDGTVVVMTGIQTAPLAGGGLQYKLKRSRFWWSVVSDGCWQS